MLSPALPPPRLSTPFRYLVLAFLLLLIVCYFLNHLSYEPSFTTSDTSVPATRNHPIDILISHAEKEFESLLATETKTLADSAAAYRKRRGRHPPPGFGDWFEFAQDNGVMLIEDFWDQIYHDLEPFWALPAARIRKDAWDFEMTINVRGHKATAGSDWFWTQIWLNLIQTIEHLLPDMDIALNAMDEPRIVVPWEDLAKFMRTSQTTRRITDVGEVITGFQKLPAAEEDPQKDRNPTKKDWETSGASNVNT